MIIMIVVVIIIAIVIVIIIIIIIIIIINNIIITIVIIISVVIIVTVIIMICLCTILLQYVLYVSEKFDIQWHAWCWPFDSGGISSYKGHPPICSMIENVDFFVTLKMLNYIVPHSLSEINYFEQLFGKCKLSIGITNVRPH